MGITVHGETYWDVLCGFSVLINEKKGKKYSLTIDGKTEFDKASQNTEILFAIWQNLEMEIKNYA